MKVDNGTTNFAVYEDATEFYGMAEVTLPEITQITEEVKGAGISGAFNGAFVGHIEAMTLTLNFRSVTADAVKLAEPRNHQLDLRAAQQYWDNTAGKFVQQAVKHVLMVTPTKFAPGKLAPAASAEASGEYAATYFATYIDGKKVLEIDITVGPWCLWFCSTNAFASFSLIGTTSSIRPPPPPQLQGPATSPDYSVYPHRDKGFRRHN